MFVAAAGELQLCCGAGENCSQIFTGGYWRPGSERWEPYPDPGSGLAVNEEVKSEHNLKSVQNEHTKWPTNCLYTAYTLSSE